MAFQAANLRSLKGIENATKADVEIFRLAETRLVAVFHGDDGPLSLPFQCWLDTLAQANESQDDAATHAASLALAITFLRARAHCEADSTKAVSGQELSMVWDVVNKALLSPLYEKARVGRSHQGFLSLPFCRLNTDNGDNDEFWRLHIWLPSSPKPDTRLIIHSHQSFAQSWILAGEAENTMWNVEQVTGTAVATNAIYKLAASFDKTLEPGSKEEVSGTIIENTGKDVIVTKAHSERSHRGQSYLVPGNAYHTTGVEDRTVLATIFFFDASRGFFKDAGVPIGPVDGTSFKQYRNPEGARLDKLVSIVEAIRRWESVTDHGVLLASDNKWTEAEEKFGQAAVAWESDAEGFRGAGSAVEARDFDGLDYYKDVAQSLQSWASYMHSGDFEEARKSCRSVFQFRAARNCLLMTPAE